MYLIQQTGTSLPGLLLDLHGRVHVKIQTKTTLINNKRIQSLVLNAPQLPVSELRVALNGGRTTGVFLNRQDLCFKGNSTPSFNDRRLAGQVLRPQRHEHLRRDRRGEGQRLRARGHRARSTARRASARACASRCEKHPDSPNFKELLVTVSDNLSLVENKINEGVDTSADASVEYVTGTRCGCSACRPRARTTITVSFRKGAIRVSDRSQNLLERGRSRTFSVKVKQTPVSGAATSTRATYRANGK